LPKPGQGAVKGSVLSEAAVREVIMGFVPLSEAQDYREFVYPLYRVEMVLKRKRIVWLDGRTGREVPPSRRPRCAELLSRHTRLLGHSEL